MAYIAKMHIGPGSQHASRKSISVTIKSLTCKKILLLNMTIAILLSQSAMAGGPPPPADYENWDASRYIKMTLISCGEQNVEERIIDGRSSLNKAAIVQNCMINNGLTLKRVDGRVAQTICNQNPDLPACLSIR